MIEEKKLDLLNVIGACAAMHCCTIPEKEWTPRLCLELCGDPDFSGHGFGSALQGQIIQALEEKEKEDGCKLDSSEVIQFTLKYILHDLREALGIPQPTPLIGPSLVPKFTFLIFSGNLASPEEAALAAYNGQDFQVYTGKHIWYFSLQEGMYEAWNDENYGYMWKVGATSVAEYIRSGQLAELCRHWDGIE